MVVDGVGSSASNTRMFNHQIKLSTILGLLVMLSLSVWGCGSSGDHGHDHPHGDSSHTHGDGGQDHAGGDHSSGDASKTTFEPDERETNFSELRRLTSRGENAEAYFAFGGDKLVMQSTSPPYECDQIFTLDLENPGEPQLVSTGKGRTTCSYFTRDDQTIVYSSTHLGDEACPPPPDRSQGYVWALYPSFDIFSVPANPTDEQRANPTRLTTEPGYDAEATISPAADRIVFTSTRDGDLDIYSMNVDGSDVKRLTDALGYDGGPFYSPDGSKIVYRAHHPKNEDEVADYKRLLDQNLIRPSHLEIWVMDADGSNKRQITDLGSAAFGPFFHPSGEKIIFSSNHHDPKGREFDLFMVDASADKAKAEQIEQITFSEQFDGFPMFSPDGEWFVFASNRHNLAPRDTNVFLTRWKD